MLDWRDCEPPPEPDDNILRDLLIVAFVVAAMLLAGEAIAQPDPAPPHAAAKYRRDLVRSARLAWGLDAPVATMAAQVQQESGWNPRAVSHVGASGLAQFMPGTSAWWCQRENIEDCTPTNPVWALRALAGYDKFLYDRLARAGGECNRWWAALRSYNGGLEHWLAEARLASDPSNRASVDRQCGGARRSIKHCAENLGYPARIINRHQPRYLSWGRGVCS